jgi:hypothetical protein
MKLRNVFNYNRNNSFFKVFKIVISVINSICKGKKKLRKGVQDIEEAPPRSNLQFSAVSIRMSDGPEYP